ncbi:hypothetical protein L218DRAFT_961733 [Marasmius fiardii PR-910]|nr:hypothetical protein L218DRAFT_961733 [Marasmius fiardii PR-910]
MSSEHHPLHFSHRRHHISYDDHDLSMLLDPAYTRPRASSSQTRVYKDNHGDIHDPDYRHFPSTSSYASSSSTSTGGRRSKRVNSGTSSIARPSWELGLGNGLDEEEYEAYYNDGEDVEEPRYHSSSRTTKRSHYPKYSPTYTAYSTSSASTSPSSSPSSFITTLSDTDLSYIPSSTTTSSPTSCKLTKRLLSRNSHTQRSSFVEEHVHPYEVDSVWEDHEETMSLPEERDREREQSPSPTASGVTASEAMRKQWQATKLSVRFGVFRAQRRVKEALGGGRR